MRAKFMKFSRLTQLIFEACIAFDMGAKKYVAVHLIRHKFPPKSIRDFY